MSTLWEQITAQPCFDRLQKHYNETFPLEVRYVCAKWIEDKILPELIYNDINDPQIELRAANFMSSLIQEVEQEKNKLGKPEEFPLKCRLDEAVKNFTQTLYHPLTPYRQICDALLFEKQYMDNININPQYVLIDDDASLIYNKLKVIRTHVHNNNDTTTRVKQLLENYMLQCTEYNKQLQTINADVEKQRVINELTVKFRTLLADVNCKLEQLLQEIRQVIELVGEVEKAVIHVRLGSWQKEQAAAGNGGPFSTNSLSDIQTWFEDLAELVWATRTTIDTIKIRTLNHPHIDPKYIEYFDNAHRDITHLLQYLIVSGFIVEKQPPQVMKTHTRFGATVRLLTTNISIHLNNPVVQVSILSEHQAQAQQKNHNTPIAEVSGEILNNTGNLELQQTSRQLICNFRNMQLKKIKRAEKKGTESVMDEKFSLLFQAKFQSGDMQLNVWVMSLPVVVIVHGNQEPQSWATITWDNAFSDVSRIPFEVVDRVVWSSMAHALNVKFSSLTGRCLTTDNIYYLCEKLFRSPITYNPEERIVTWSQFCKETLPERNFTFWDWFYAVMKLTRDQLRGPWCDNLIIGFITKKQTEDMLKKCPTGTFLLRFSDSELGGITIAWVKQGLTEPQIVMLQPFSNKDFGIRSLSDRIQDLPQCVYLYPDIPKDQAFGKYYTPIGETTCQNGYVKHTLKAVPAEVQTGYPQSPMNNNNGWPSPDNTTRDTASVTSFYNTSMNGNENADATDFAMLDDLDMYQ